MKSPLVRTIEDRGLASRFIAFCAPHIRSGIVRKWLSRNTQREWSVEQIAVARRTMGCQADPGGPRNMNGIKAIHFVAGEAGKAKRKAKLTS